ncbi:MAG: UDP-2,3-diacylglucosamine diphosphatase [Salinisphaeraceae bacterium]|nr:UDP-2,3-diacylglucosamine diphosphatase [Salinisphaeraceae bacterium]
MSIHFISDLHLSDEKPGISRLFIDYLSGPARSADIVYLLGDIFEYWIGDDASMPQYQNECSALRSLADSGVKTFFMHGNRDFLVGEAFAQATGCSILEDPCTIDLYGQDTLLTHGDFLCTDDVKHQEFRAFALDPQNQKQILSLPIEQREKIAQGIRLLSKSNNAHEPADIIDVNQQAIENCLREYKVSRIIHGHTHRPATHEFELDGQPAIRTVLSDWHEDEGFVLICDEDSASTLKLSPREF